MTNFLNRALMRRKRQQNGDAAGGVVGGVQCEVFWGFLGVFFWWMEPTFNSSFFCSLWSHVFSPRKVKDVQKKTTKKTKQKKTRFRPFFFTQQSQITLNSPLHAQSAHLFWPKLVLIIKVDEHVDGGVKFRSLSAPHTHTHTHTHGNGALKTRGQESRGSIGPTAAGCCSPTFASSIGKMNLLLTCKVEPQLGPLRNRVDEKVRSLCVMEKKK